MSSSPSGSSSIQLILTRHEQAAAFMAATYGRLTGRPGVCITTLGPGALNLSTGAAYALLGAMPMIMITGQKGILSSRQARFQIVDIVAAMKPLTKLSRQIVSPLMIPTLVREAFRVAQEERPGPVHLELPEDIAAAECEPIALVPPHPVELPLANADSLDRAARMIVQAQRPLLMLGAAASRPRSTSDLAQFVLRTRIPYFTTQMGKGTVPGGTELYMGTAALSERDYVHEAIERADLIITIGHDTVEKPPFIMGAEGPKVIHVGYQPAEGRAGLLPSGGSHRRPRPVARLLADRVEGKIPNAQALLPLREGILNRIAARATEDRFTPQRLVHDVREVMPADGIRGARQRHVQDLVCAKLSNARREYTPARQRTGDDGSGSAVRDHGRDAVSRTPRHGRLRRRRIHDEQPGAGNGREAQAQSRRFDHRGPRLRHDPLETGGRPFPRFRHDVRQP